MKEIENLRKNLRNLPKYTLNEDQKERVILAIEGENETKKRVQFIKPYFVFALMCVIVFVLFLASESNGWVNEVRQLFQPKIELNAREATVFKNNNDVLGIEGRVGILVSNEQFVAEDVRRGSKLMLYFWGDSSKLINKNYRVEAVNAYNEKINLSEGTLYAPLNSEDAHTLTNFPPFPIEGKWQLSFFVEDQLFEEFTVEVLPPFPKTENYTLIDSPMEIKVGKESEIDIESSVESGEEIEVKLLDKKGNVESESIFVQNGKYIMAGSDIYHYQGKIKFPEQGTWKLQINGERTKLFKN